MTTYRDTYQEVTDQIVAALEAGRVPWRRPWNVDVGQPRSIDGRPYRGINALLLGMSEFDDPRWGTFNAIRRHGGHVRRGERSTLVVLWKPIDVRDADAPGGKRRVLMLRYFRVFNVAQAAGMELEPMERGAGLESDEVTAAAEGVAAEYPAPPTLSYGGTSAHYVPARDHVQIPPLASFESARGFATTLFHELVHSTGHESRLNRDELMASNGFGSEPYSREELVAEIGAGMVAAGVGIEPDYRQSAAYIGSWLAALRNDKKLIVSAAARAQKATDWILGTPAPTADEVTA